jgi:hypothetical protein
VEDLRPHEAPTDDVGARRVDAEAGAAGDLDGELGRVIAEAAGADDDREPELLAERQLERAVAERDLESIGERPAGQIADPGDVAIDPLDRNAAGRERRSCWRSSVRPSKLADHHGGVLGADLVTGESLQDLLPGQGLGRVDANLGIRVGAIAIGLAKAERPDERLDAGPDGRIRDPELALHVAEVAAGAEEALEEGQLFAAQAAEAADAEVAFERRPARPAVQPGHGELTGADGASGDHIMWHWLRFLLCVG